MNKGTPLINNQAGSSRMDTVLKMLLIAFIALLAFSSGVFFGKQLSDTDYQLRALESDFSNSHGAKTAENGHDQSPEDAINQDEVAALSDKLVNGEKADLESNEHGAQTAGAHGEEARKVASSEDPHHEAAPAQAHEAAPAGHGAAPAAHGTAPAAHAAAAEAPKAEHAAPPAAHGATKTQPAAAQAPTHTTSATQKPDLTAAAKAAIRIANNAAPNEAPKAGAENRVPTSLPKTVGTSQDVEFTVQVASYPTAQIAKEHADELIKKGFPAFPVEATVNGKIWYRVSVGSFKTQREATVYRAQLLKQTSLPSAIVQKITR